MQFKVISVYNHLIQTFDELNMSSDNEARMVRWRCNRGMLELDLLLIPFAENHFRDLSKEEKQQFIELLTYEDPTLFAWLMGHETAADDMLSIVNLVKKLK